MAFIVYGFYFQLQWCGPCFESLWSRKESFLKHLLLFIYYNGAQTHIHWVDKPIESRYNQVKSIIPTCSHWTIEKKQNMKLLETIIHILTISLGKFSTIHKNSRSSHFLSLQSWIVWSLACRPDISSQTKFTCVPIG